MTDTVADYEQDDSVRCLVVRGAGDHFMAGGDVKGMSDTFKMSAEQIRKQYVLRIHDLHPIMFAMRRMPKPIVAQVAGGRCGPQRRAIVRPDRRGGDVLLHTAYANIGTARTAPRPTSCRARSASSAPWK